MVTLNIYKKRDANLAFEVYEKEGVTYCEYWTNDLTYCFQIFDFN